MLVKEAASSASTLRCSCEINTGDVQQNNECPDLVFLPQFLCVLFFHLEHSPLFCGILCIVHLRSKTAIEAQVTGLSFFFVSEN